MVTCTQKKNSCLKFHCPECLILFFSPNRIIQCSNIVSESSDNANNATLIELLDHVRRCFPNCLESDILLINCAWEILLQWHHQPLLFSSELQCTFSYLEKVSNSVLKHNIASMIWRLFIQKRFEILCNLIEKMGKKPKDRICRRELQMGLFRFYFDVLHL